VPYRYVAERLLATPTAVDLGALTPKEAVQREVLISNPVATPITISSVRLTGRESGYRIVSTTPAVPVTLDPGASLRVLVEILPAIDGRLYSDTVIVLTECSSVRVPLTAETVKPLIDVSDVDFGTLAVGQSKRLPMYIRNVGRGHITFANDAGRVIEWLESTFYVDPVDIERVRTARIGPDSSLTVMVTFLGAGVGAYRDEARVFASTRENRDVSLWTATVVKPGPQIVGDAFGARQITAQNECTKNDTASYGIVLPIYNTGTSPFEVVEIKLIGADADAGIFAKDESDPANNVLPYTRVRPVANLDTQTVFQRFVFRPDAERSYSATVRMVVINPLNNVLDSADAILTGSGIETHLSVADLALPKIEFTGVGATTQQGTIRVSALPTRPLTISDIEIVPNTGEFVILGPAGYRRTYEPGSFVDLVVEFRPTAPGERSAELRVIGDHAVCDDSVGTITAETFRKDPEVPPGAELSATVTGMDFGSVTGCSDSTAIVTLRNTSTGAIRVTRVTLASGAPEFVVVLPDVPVIVAKDASLSIPVRFTPASGGTFAGELEFEFELDDINADSVALRTAALTGRSETAAATASIARDFRTFPGGMLRVPVMLDNQVNAAKVDDLVFELYYARGMMAATIDAAKLDELVAGTLLDGWNVTLLDHREDAADAKRMLIRLRATAPEARTLRGSGALLNLDFRTFIGDTMKTELPFSIVTPGRSCTEITTTTGAAALDSICGLSFRIIEASATTYALRQNAPNPFNPTTTIEFAVGLDAATRLEIYDATGNLVATLVDAFLTPGTYSVTWDASSYPSGIYYYRFTSGQWSRTSSMMLEK
jgi:hypothetical protein